MNRNRIARLFALSLLLASCSVLRNFDGFDTGDAGEPTAPEAGPGAEAGADASDDADAEPKNLCPNGDFEKGCDGWRVYRATIEPTAIAHSGKGACRVCPTEDAGNFSTGPASILASNPRFAAEYHVQAWVQRDPERPALDRVGVLLRTSKTLDGSFVEVEKQFSERSIRLDGWNMAETTLLVIKENTAALDFSASAEAASGGCFLIDDVVCVKVE